MVKNILTDVITKATKTSLFVLSVSVVIDHVCHVITCLGHLRFSHENMDLKSPINFSTDQSLTKAEEC